LASSVSRDACRATATSKALAAAEIRLSSVTLPSTHSSAISTAFRLRWSVNKCHRLRQQAAPNSRNFRSLTLPRRNSSIFSGSLQASHSASVTVFSPLVPSVVQLAA
jgi:hypothetical protein